MQKYLLLTFITVAIFFSQSFAQDITKSSNKNYRISLEQKEVYYDFDYDTIEVQINSSALKLKGFALKIATQSQFVHIDTIIAGDFFNECGWEFFNTREIISDFTAENYIQAWQIIGLSEIFPDSISPVCYANETKQSLAKIVISRNKYSQPIDSLVPFFFLWEDCADNTLSGMSGNELFVSNQIFKYFENQPQFEKNQFPSTQGVSQKCLNKSSLNAPVKAVDFMHGGIMLVNRVLNDSLILNR